MADRGQGAQGTQPLPRPYIAINTAMSLDGCINDTSGRRLILSNGEDFAYVDRLRARADAVLVGAQTVRSDNPSLLVKDPAHIAARTRAGRAPQPTKVTVTQSGALPADSRFFHTPGDKLVYCTMAHRAALQAQLGDLAEVVALPGEEPEPPEVAADLARRGIAWLLVEGGGRVNRALLAAEIVDSLRIAIAPLFVGEPLAPHVVGPGVLPQNHASPMQLRAIEQLGSMAVLHYQLHADAPPMLP